MSISFFLRCDGCGKPFGADPDDAKKTLVLRHAAEKVGWVVSCRSLSRQTFGSGRLDYCEVCRKRRPAPLRGKRST